MDKNLTIKERILHYADTKGISKSNLYETIGAAASNFKGIGLKSEIGGSILVKFLTYYNDVNPEWLLTGEGEMIRKEKCADAIKVTSGGIPLLPIDAMAGIARGEISVLEYECERYVVPVFKEAEFLIPVKGSSMIPKYNSGDIVACKWVPLKDIFFQWNKVYVLDTNQGALIKRVHKGSDAQHITLVSDNAKYEPFEVAISSINAIAIVVGVIRLE